MRILHPYAADYISYIQGVLLLKKHSFILYDFQKTYIYIITTIVHFNNILNFLDFKYKFKYKFFESHIK